MFLDTDVARKRKTVLFKSLRAFGEIRPKVYVPRRQIAMVECITFTLLKFPFPSYGGELHWGFFFVFVFVFFCLFVFFGVPRAVIRSEPHMEFPGQ